MALVRRTPPVSDRGYQKGERGRVSTLLGKIMCKLSSSKQIRADQPPTLCTRERRTENNRKAPDTSNHAAGWMIWAEGAR